MNPKDFYNEFSTNNQNLYDEVDLKYLPFKDWGTRGHCFASSSLWLNQFYSRPFGRVFAGADLLCNPENQVEQKSLIENYQSQARFFDWDHPSYYQDLNVQLNDFSLKTEPHLSHEGQSLLEALKDYRDAFSEQKSGLIFMQSKKGVSSQRDPGHVIAFAFRHHPEKNISVMGFFDTALGQIILQINPDKLKFRIEFELSLMHETYVPVSHGDKVEPDLSIAMVIKKMSTLLSQRYVNYHAVILKSQPLPCGKCILHRHAPAQAQQQIENHTPSVFSTNSPF